MQSLSERNRKALGFVFAVLVFGATAWAVKTQILDLGTTGTIAAQDVYINRDASNNMQFVDPNAGALTLSDFETVGYWALSGAVAILAPNRDIDMQSTATLTNVPTPSAAGEVANKAYVDSQLTVSGGTYIADGGADDTKIDTDTEGDGSGNIITFDNAGSESARLDASGNLVIGNTSARSILNTYENTTDTDAGAGATIEQDSTGDALLHLLLTATRRWIIGIDNSDSDKLKIGTAAAGAGGVGLSTYTLALTTAGNMELQSGDLDVGGDGSFDDSLTVNAGKGADGDLVVYGDDENVLFRVDTSAGQVAVGPHSASNDLTVSSASAGDTSIDVINTSTGDPVVQFNNQSTYYGIGLDNTDNDKFQICNTTGVGANVRFSMTSAGLFGLNVTTPTECLQIDGALYLEDMTEPTTGTESGAKLFSKAGSLVCLDDDGTTTLLSSHNAKGEWVHVDGNSARGLEVDMERFMLALDVWYRREVDPSADPFVRITYPER